jgi:DNA repair protein RadC
MPHHATPTPPLRIRELPRSAQPHYRLATVGPEALSDAELLAILLNAESLAWCDALLTRFGGWVGLRRATLTELQQAHGIGPEKAHRIQAACELHRRMTTAGYGERPQIKSPADAALLLQAEIGHCDQEHLVTVILDTKNFVLKLHHVYIGNVNTAIIRVGEVFKEALRRNAAAIILAHNHPTGQIDPSPEDILLTRQVAEAGKLLDLELLDHLIVSPAKFCSLRERGFGFNT